MGLAGQFKVPVPEPDPPVLSGDKRVPEAGQAKAEPWETLGPEVGQVILRGRYRVEKFLDRGGMGQVWQVRHLHMDRLEVLKLIDAQFAISAEAMTRFKREAKVMATLDHPNIVRVFDAGVASVSAYILMEFVPGSQPQ
jgi:hypothetical protein